jgi:hypothetical protein
MVAAGCDRAAVVVGLIGKEVFDLEMFHRKLFQEGRMLLQDVKILIMSVSACATSNDGRLH